MDAKNEKKRKPQTITFSDEEIAAVNRAAERAGVPRATFIRNAALVAARARESLAQSNEKGSP